MARYKVKELADMVGVKPQTINTWGKRGKLNIVGGIIDTKHPANAEFVRNKVGSKSEPEPVKKKAERQVPEREIISVQPESETYKSQRVLNNLKALKLKAELEKLNLENKRVMSELIPTNFAKELFNRYIRAASSAFYNMADNYTADMCSKLGVGRELLAELRGKLKKEINESIENAKNEAKKDLEILCKSEGNDEKS